MKAIGTARVYREADWQDVTSLWEQYTEQIVGIRPLLALRIAAEVCDADGLSARAQVNLEQRVLEWLEDDGALLFTEEAKLGVKYGLLKPFFAEQAQVQGD